jgi:hypothetical protein
LRDRYASGLVAELHRRTQDCAGEDNRRARPRTTNRQYFKHVVASLGLIPRRPFYDNNEKGNPEIMSTESELNQPSASVETAAPTADYTPMADPVAAEEPKRKVYDGNDAETIREAAADLDKARAENRIPRADDEPVDRSYVHYTGEKAGERVAPNETLTADRAARDIETIRQWEAASQQPQPADEAAAVDALRRPIRAATG